MIQLLEGSCFPTVEDANPFILAKITANFLAYGNGFSFLTFWVQEKENNITAIICKMENTLFVTANSLADFSELSDFVNIIGFECLQTDPFTVADLGLERGKTYTLLKRASQNNSLENTKDFPPLKEVYDILFSLDEADIDIIDFNGWYADMSHKIRHNCALAVLLPDCAAAIASHITPTAAVISGVAVKGNKRGNGFGRQAVEKLLSAIGNKTVYTAADTATEFYIKSGFEICGEIEIIKRNC